MWGPYVLPLVTLSDVEVWGMAFRRGQLIALIAGEYKDSVPVLYSLSYSPYIPNRSLSLVHPINHL